MSVGSRDGIGPGDLLAAAVDQAGIERGQVGRIEIQETFTRVEIRQEVAEKVVRALNGITLGAAACAWTITESTRAALPSPGLARAAAASGPGREPGYGNPRHPGRMT